MNTFTYKARVRRVVDGDTFEVTADLGFRLYYNLTVRPNTYDAPETYRPRNMAEKQHGMEATHYLKELIEGKDIYITTTEEDSFGRWLATVKLLTGEDLGKVMGENDLLKRESY